MTQSHDYVISVRRVDDKGRYDRNVLPTRTIEDGKLKLRDEGRPEHESKWGVMGTWSGE